MHFGFRALVAQPDERLAKIAYSRVHHRVLYFIARNPGCSINELLSIMGVSKQYLHRPLKQLVEDGYVLLKTDCEDKRIKRIHLTERGKALEFDLSDNQRARFQKVFNLAGPQAEAGWREVMRLLAEFGDD
ncbi:MAG TPA: MarR family transcriptional regulator [Gammaproteobacteria bacterium]|nr:MarR family transcriptional regulator [Gammaproteobacteria bacterium]